MDLRDEQSLPVLYDIDNVPQVPRKMALAKSVECSPCNYSIMRSVAPRFLDSADGKPFGNYNIDTGTKKTLESCCRDTRRFYAASFSSIVPRFNRPWSSPTSDIFYDPVCTKSCFPNSLEKSIETTPVNYAIHRSKYRRFPDRPIMSEAPDVTYEVDGGHKMTLYTAIVHSPITYGNMGAPTKKFGSTKGVSHRPSLGPGSYDAQHPADFSISSSLHQRPLSSMASTTQRFIHRKVPGFGLGSTYKPELEAKSWHNKARTISKAEYVRPVYLPNTYKAKH